MSTSATSTSASSESAEVVSGFSQLTQFGGFDWAQEEHQLVVVDPKGQIVLSLRFADDAAGWAMFREKIAGFARLGVAIETNCGPAVERLLDIGLAVYPMNPKAAERYRDRKAPSGAKSDYHDANRAGTKGCASDRWSPMAAAAGAGSADRGAAHALPR